MVAAAVSLPARDSLIFGDDRRFLRKCSGVIPERNCKGVKSIASLSPVRVRTSQGCGLLRLRERSTSGGRFIVPSRPITRASGRLRIESFCRVRSLSSDNESSGLHARVPEHIAYQLRDTGERIPEHFGRAADAGMSALFALRLWTTAAYIRRPVRACRFNLSGGVESRHASSGASPSKDTVKRTLHHNAPAKGHSRSSARPAQFNLTGNGAARHLLSRAPTSIHRCRSSI